MGGMGGISEREGRIVVCRRWAAASLCELSCPACRPLPARCHVGGGKVASACMCDQTGRCVLARCGMSTRGGPEGGRFDRKRRRLRLLPPVLPISCTKTKPCFWNCRAAQRILGALCNKSYRTRDFFSFTGGMDLFFCHERNGRAESSVFCCCCEGA